MKPDSTSWWHATATAPNQRVRAVTAAPAERSLVQRLLPSLTGWIRVGAPVSLVDALSVARLTVLAVLTVLPMFVMVGELPWVAASALAGAGLTVLVATYRSTAAPHRVASCTAGASMALTLTALGLATGVHRVGLTLLPLSVGALFIGLFLHVRAILLTLVGGSISLAIVVRFTADHAGSANLVPIAFACWLVAVMSAALAYGSRQAGSIDADTGIPNARGLQRVLGRASEPMLVTTIRLVGVSAARDALGHDAGSELVRAAVSQLTRVTTPSMRLGRVADDEIVLLLPMAMSRDDAERIALRAAATALGDRRYLIGDVEVAVEAHLGVAAWEPATESRRRPGVRRRPTQDAPAGPSDTSHPEATQAVESARDALRRSALAARQAAVAGVAMRTWDGVATTLTADDLELLADLRCASERGELRIAYQPQVRAADGAVASVEALMRWRHPVRGDVSPERFVALAERTGLIDRLTDWMFSEALDAQVRWRAAGLHLDVSVNVSPLSLRRTDFAGRVSEAIVLRELPASILTVELTESSSFDVPQAIRRLRPLRELGVRISIDDFGTGYTSLAILPDLDIDEIKLDQCFVRNAVASPASEAIVRSMCELAHRLGLMAVAEGAETDDIVHRLQVAGYDLIQGYAFAAPMLEEDLIGWLRQRELSATALGALAVDAAAAAPSAAQAPTSPTPPTPTPAPARPAPTAVAAAPADPIDTQIERERLGPLPTISFVGAMGSATLTTAEPVRPEPVPRPQPTPPQPTLSVPSPSDSMPPPPPPSAAAATGHPAPPSLPTDR